MFGYKIIKVNKHKELLAQNAKLLIRDKVLDSRIKDSKLSTYEELRELRTVIMKEYSDVERRLKMMININKSLKNSHG